MSRIERELGGHLLTLLDTQYRMHERIMNWSSREFYEGRLQAHESVRTHTLPQLCPSTLEHEDLHSDERLGPLVLIDTQHCEPERFGELLCEDDESKVRLDDLSIF